MASFSKSFKDSIDVVNFETYVQPITAIGVHGVELLRTLLKLLAEFHTSLLQTHRSQGSSPAPGALVQIHQPNFAKLHKDIKKLCVQNSLFPGIDSLLSQFDALQDAFNHDGENDRDERVEKLSYESGVLRGQLEMIIQHYTYWISKVPDQQSQVERQQKLPHDSVLQEKVAVQCATDVGGCQGRQHQIVPVTQGHLAIVQNCRASANSTRNLQQGSSGTSQSHGIIEHIPSLQLIPQESSTSSTIFHQSLVSSESKQAVPMSTQELHSSEGLSTTLCTSVVDGISQQTRVVAPLPLGSAVRSNVSHPTQGLSMRVLHSSSSGRHTAQGSAISGNCSAASRSNVHEHSQSLLSFSGDAANPEPTADLFPDRECYTVVVRHTDQVFGTISNLWETKQHSDVTLLTDCTQISAHKIILASQSDYFDRLLFGSMMEAQQDRIKIEDIGNIDAFMLLMKYAYSGSLEIQDGNLQVVLDVLALSDRFGFVLLKNSIGSYLSSKLNAGNATDLLVHSDLYHIEELHDKCLAFFDKNAVEVLESDAVLSLPELSLKSVVDRDSFYAPEISIFQAVVRWKEHNKVEVEALSEVLQCIRLSEVSPQDIFEVVEPYCLFSESQVLNAVRIQVKQEFQHMKPRGRKVPSKNLFAHAAKLDQSLQYSGISTSAPPTSITMGVVHLGTKYNSYATPTAFSSGSRKHAVVTLEDVFLINFIELEGIPTTKAAVVSQNNSFSYELMISKDKKNWSKLVDYSDYGCYGVQKLILPTVAFKYLRFQLTSENSYAIKFVCCEFKEDCCDMTQLREGGVMAPLSSTFCPLFLQSEYKRPDSLPAVLVAFNQPYTISQLRFRVCGPASFDTEIAISVSTSYQENTFKNVTTSKNKLPSSLLTVTFKDEEVVCYIMVTIKVLPSPTMASLPLIKSYYVTDLSCQVF